MSVLCGTSLKRRVGERLCLNEMTLCASYTLSAVLKGIMKSYLVLKAVGEQMENIGTVTKKWDKSVRFLIITLHAFKYPPSNKKRTFHKMVFSFSA